jgi:uncharacterized caspase-like protein
VVRPVAVLAVLAVVPLWGCGSLVTGEGASGYQNWAVIVGIAEYQSSSLNLKYADEDALDFYDALRRGKGWETEKMTLLTNGSATRDAIKGAIAGLAKRVSSDDQVVFYFSGRGSYGPDQPPFDEADGLDEYLVPADALANSTARDLSDDDLEALFAELPTNNVLVILDTGFSGSVSRPGLPSATEKCVIRPSTTVAPRAVDGMSHELARPGYLYMTAAQTGAAGRESAELRNGVFTHYLLEGMRNAETAGKNGITVQQAFDFAASRTSGFEPGQTPQLLDNRGRKFGLLFF